MSDQQEESKHSYHDQKPENTGNKTNIPNIYIVAICLQGGPVIVKNCDRGLENDAQGRIRRVKFLIQRYYSNGPEVGK